MCKVLILTNTQKIQGSKKLINAAIDLLSTERDGFGYLIQGLKGDYIERTNEIKGFRASIDRKFEPKSFEVVSYSRQGEFSKAKGAALFHGRISTNNKEIQNVHPIQKNNWSLIHNGVVTNHGPKYLKNTQNDTEDLVHYLSTEGISGIEKHLSGYYAAGAIDPDGRLHIIKDSTARLYTCEVPDWNTQVFATTPDIIEGLCDSFKVKPSVISPVKDNVYLIYDKGELVSFQNITPRGYTSKESSFASLSLGRELKAVDNYGQDFGQSWQDSPLDYDIDGYLLKIEKCKAEVEIWDRSDRKITYTKFDKLSLDDKLECTVFDYAGFLIEPDAYLGTLNKKGG